MFVWHQRGGNIGVWIALPGFPIRWALGGGSRALEDPNTGWSGKKTLPRGMNGVHLVY